MLDELLEKRVLSQEEMDKIKLANITVMDKARDLCDHVTKKGPRASQMFITYICNEDCYLAGILELQSGPSAETVVVTEDSKGGHPFSSGTHTGRGKTPSRPSSCLPFSHGVYRGWGAMCN